MTTRQILLAIAIADVLIFGALIGREVMAREHGQAVRLPVRGYDPRDILSGHFIRFRLKAAEEADALGTDAMDYCLEAQDGRHHISGVRYTADDCNLYLHRAEPNFGVDRFYIDERKSHDLAWIPNDADAYIVAVVGRDGLIHVTNLVIDGKPVAD